MVSQIGSSLSAVYQPYALPPYPKCFSSYSRMIIGSPPYDMPEVCVSRSLTVICRRAGTMTRFESLAGFVESRRTATVVLAKVGIQRLTGSDRLIFPSSTSISAATLVIALDCDAMRKIASVVMRLLASRSDHPIAFS